MLKDLFDILAGDNLLYLNDGVCIPSTSMQFIFNNNNNLLKESNRKTLVLESNKKAKKYTLLKQFQYQNKQNIFSINCDNILSTTAMKTANKTTRIINTNTFKNAKNKNFNSSFNNCDMQNYKFKAINKINIKLSFSNVFRIFIKLIQLFTINIIFSTATKIRSKNQKPSVLKRNIFSTFAFTKFFLKLFHFVSLFKTIYLSSSIIQLLIFIVFSIVSPSFAQSSSKFFDLSFYFICIKIIIIILKQQ